MNKFASQNSALFAAVLDNLPDLDPVITGVGQLMGMAKTLWSLGKDGVSKVVMTVQTVVSNVKALTLPDSVLNGLGLASLLGDLTPVTSALEIAGDVLGAVSSFVAGDLPSPDVLKPLYDGINAVSSVIRDVNNIKEMVRPRVTLRSSRFRPLIRTELKLKKTILLLLLNYYLQ